MKSICQSVATRMSATVPRSFPFGWFQSPRSRVDAIKSLPAVRQSFLGMVTLLIFAAMFATGISVGASSVPDSAFTAVGCDVGSFSCYYAAVSTNPYGYTGYYVYPAAASQVYASSGIYGYQYTDDRFCGDGQITATAQGYFCTTTGLPAWRSDGTTSTATTASVSPYGIVNYSRVG